MRRSCWDYIL